MHSLPTGHPVKLWCVERVAGTVLGWAAAHDEDDAAHGGRRPAEEAGSSRQQPLRAAAGHAVSGGPAYTAGGAGGVVLLPHAAVATSGAALEGEASRGAQLDRLSKMSSLLGRLLLEVDYALLPPSLERVAGAVRGAGPRYRPLLLQKLLDEWMASDDYARRQVLLGALRAHVAQLPAADVVYRSAL